MYIERSALKVPSTKSLGNYQFIPALARVNYVMYNASRLQCLSLTMPWTLQKKLETEHSALSSDYRRVLVYVIYYKYINSIAYNLKV